MLAGIESPSGGTVLPPGGNAWRLGDSSVLQSFLTAEQNVRIIADMKGVDPDWTSAFVMDLSELGLRYYESLRTFSSSMRGRLGFALSLALPCDYYIADQGIQVGIGRYRDKCESLLNDRLADTGMFLITSNQSFAKRTCDEFAVLRDGKFVRCSDYREALDMFEEREDEFGQIEAMIAAYPQGETP
jgi:capsular polysaccharide transport system ATP-binding protein